MNCPENRIVGINMNTVVQAYFRISNTRHYHSKCHVLLFLLIEYITKEPSPLFAIVITLVTIFVLKRLPFIRTIDRLGWYIEREAVEGHDARTKAAMRVEEDSLRDYCGMRTCSGDNNINNIHCVCVLCYQYQISLAATSQTRKVSSRREYSQHHGRESLRFNFVCNINIISTYFVERWPHDVLWSMAERVLSAAPLLSCFDKTIG